MNLKKSKRLNEAQGDTLKTVIPHLRRGDLIWAEVVEVNPDKSLICNFHGDLLRVENRSRYSIGKGTRLRLRIEESGQNLKLTPEIVLDEERMNNL